MAQFIPEWVETVRAGSPLPKIKSFADPAADAFRDEVRAWLAHALPEAWRTTNATTEDGSVEIRRAWDRLLFSAGYAGLSWPAEFGGREAGPIVETIFFEELARARAPEGLGRIGRVMAGPLIIAHGTDAQRRRFLPRILDGSEIWCLGYSEPNAGSDLAAVSTRAARNNGSYRIHGRKIWTSHAHHASRCVLLARTSADGPRYRNLSVLLVDMMQPGVVVTPVITAAGDHHFNEVLFDGAVAGSEDRLGPENEGWRIFRSSLAFERGGAVALNHYLEMRHQCDTLADCCAVRSAVPGAPERARLLGDQVELIRWHVMRMNEMEANGISPQSVQIVLKLFFSELWQQLTDFGARLMCERHDDFWRYHYLRSRAATIYAGTSEIQRDMIARCLLSGRA